MVRYTTEDANADQAEPGSENQDDGAELHPDWVPILNRRAAEIDSGAEVSIPMEQAFANARAALRRGQRAAG